MALHLTKVAFGAASIDHLAERLALRAADGPAFLTTRYLPKRHEEVAGQGSLFWILKHQLVARSPILSFGEAEGGRCAIHIDPALVLVQALPRRAHQGWRYLKAEDAPRDLREGETDISELPGALASDLTRLGLV